MKLPSKIVDISQPLDNETVVDPDFMRPSIRCVTGKENAALMCELFPSLTEDQLPGGEGWAIEFIELATHNGTHMDAPYHYNSRDSQGNRMPTIDELPPFGFTVACFPCKIKAASGGWTRAVALFD